ncbi:MAG: M3 family oligoendopeptidase, partial [Firmicutes bacterium]|nr:M3 family oligoendopeptidase [Bacillota bacterium]
MLKFKDMPYERPDMEAAKKELARLAEALKEAGSYEAAKSVFLEKDALKKHIETQAALAQIRQTIDTRDEFYDQEVNFWNEAGPELMEYEQMWTKALLATPYREQLTEEFGNVIFLNAELEEKSFAPSIIPQMQKENDLTLEYEKLIAGAQIPFNGKTYTIAQIQPFKSDADDDVRLAAWKAEGGWYKEHQQDLDRIYDEMVALRDEMGKKLGFEDFVDLGYCRMGRNCYDRNDIDKFRAAVRDYIVPVADMVRRRQAERLGMQYPLSFADCALLFRSGNPKPAGGEEEILAAAKRFYDALSPETSEFFQTMLDYELMDLLAKEGKAGGGYCEGIFDYEVPFIFANFNGTRDDVETVTHEAGHAFAAYMNRKRVPMETVWPGMESCEVHSMS